MSPMPKRPVAEAFPLLVVTHGVASANTSDNVTGRPSCATRSASSSRTIRTLVAPASSAFWTISERPCSRSPESPCAPARAPSTTAFTQPSAEAKRTPNRSIAARADAPSPGLKPGSRSGCCSRASTAQPSRARSHRTCPAGLTYSAAPGLRPASRARNHPRYGTDPCSWTWASRDPTCLERWGMYEPSRSSIAR